MFDIQNYASFIAAVLVFQLVPGPGTLAILNAAARSGRGTGLGVVAGTLLGDFVYMVGAVLGLSAVMYAHPLPFEILRWLGAAYLCWLGVQLLRSPGASGEGGRVAAQGRWRHFRQGCVVSLTNPKVMLFFIAFFPLFLRDGASPLTLVAMMAHVTLISLLYQAGLVLAGNAAACRLSRMPSVRRVVTRMAGIAFIGFGVKLAGRG